MPTWRRKNTEAPTPVAGPQPPVRRDEWRRLAPIQRVAGEHPLINPLQRFSPSLASWRNPSYVESLGHRVGPDEPAGVIADLATPRPADISVPPMPMVTPKPSVQRTLWSRWRDTAVQRSVQRDVSASQDDAVAVETPVPAKEVESAPEPVAPMISLPVVSAAGGLGQARLTSAPVSDSGQPPVRTLQVVQRSVEESSTEEPSTEKPLEETPAEPVAVMEPAAAVDGSTASGQDEVTTAELPSAPLVSSAPAPLPTPSPRPVTPTPVVQRADSAEPSASVTHGTSAPVVQRSGPAKPSAPRRLGLGAPLLPPSMPMLQRSAEPDAESGEPAPVIEATAETRAETPKEAPVEAESSGAGAVEAESATESQHEEDAPLTGETELGSVQRLAEEGPPPEESVPLDTPLVDTGVPRSAEREVAAQPPSASAVVQRSPESGTDAPENAPLLSGSGTNDLVLPMATNTGGPETTSIDRALPFVTADSPRSVAGTASVQRLADSDSPSTTALPVTELSVAELPVTELRPAEPSVTDPRMAELPVKAPLGDVHEPSLPTLGAATVNQDHPSTVDSTAIGTSTASPRSVLPVNRIAEPVQRLSDGDSPGLSVTSVSSRGDGSHGQQTVLLPPESAPQHAGSGLPMTQPTTQQTTQPMTAATTQPTVSRLVGDRTSVPPRETGSLPTLAVAGAVQMAQRSAESGPSHAFPAAVPPVVSRLIGDGAPLASPVAAPAALAEEAPRRPDPLPVPVLRHVEEPLPAALPLQRYEPVRAAEVVTEVQVAKTVQREETTPEPAPAPEVPVTTVASPAPAPVPPVEAPPETDELVKKLFDPLLRRLKTELRLDRERRGALTDRRH